ncbi:tropomyosin-like [Anopheles darlingi]|uniref:tropomyosin-like n=1 Tax=Anopheles darlingi TaxID=43151 RepID=UPI002100210A|nr:tropomyosin-like [Anopheles darlingi]XP_049538736.1 tropomyosin-like [Anopheles darlingi]
MAQYKQRRPSQNWNCLKCHNLEEQIEELKNDLQTLRELKSELFRLGIIATSNLEKEKQKLIEENKHSQAKLIATQNKLKETEEANMVTSNDCTKLKEELRMKNEQLKTLENCLSSANRQKNEYANKIEGLEQSSKIDQVSLLQLREENDKLKLKILRWTEENKHSQTELIATQNKLKETKEANMVTSNDCTTLKEQLRKKNEQLVKSQSTILRLQCEKNNLTEGLQQAFKEWEGKEKSNRLSKESQCLDEKCIRETQKRATETNPSRICKENKTLVNTLLQCEKNSLNKELQQALKVWEGKEKSNQLSKESQSQYEKCIRGVQSRITETNRSRVCKETKTLVNKDLRNFDKRNMENKLVFDGNKLGEDLPRIEEIFRARDVVI